MSFTEKAIWPQNFLERKGFSKKAAETTLINVSMAALMAAIFGISTFLEKPSSPQINQSESLKPN
ncbi:MAG TPA: hypothetical protein VI957_03800 [Candidatus Paceibacterota bacterium]